MKRFYFFLIGLTAMVSAQAQRIDINNTSNWAEDRLTETGYTAWPVGTVSSATITVDGITVTASLENTSSAQTLKGNWWKDGVQKYSKLVSDGLAVYGLDGGNTPQIQEGAVAMTITISGLAAGEHSILAYHNNTDGYEAPNLEVLVDGVRMLEGVAQTNRAQTMSASGKSYVKFQAQAGKDVVVTYRTTPDPSFDYTQGYNTTTLFVNGLVFDRPNPATTAYDPVPSNNDMHFNGGQQLQWTAADAAVRHHVWVGTSPDNLSEMAVSTAPNFTLDDMNTADTYYWRVDEESADGTVYQGDVWTFRKARLAFPGAEGYGRFAIGGRGGSVYHVTSLDDDAADPQPGSFRYGITKVSGPRTIVFDVAGVITLKDRLTCSDACVTIAGQTAPGKGIMFRGNPFGISNDNIARFLRMRLGYKEREDASGRDGLGINGDHSIMDHCSVGWTIDEAFSSRGAKNVSLQRTLISEALNIADHPNYAVGKGHGYAATIGGDTGSYHHNLLAHNEGRNWSMAGGLDGGGAYAGHHDMFNNVCYNWGSRATDGGTHEGNFVNNYYKMGPSTTKKVLLQADLEGTGTGSQSYYVSGNIRENLDGTRTSDAEGETYTTKLSGGQVVDWTVFVAAPFFESYATVESAEAAYQNVLSDVGCNYAGLDNHDLRMVSETLLGTTSTTGLKSGKAGLIDREDDAEGFEGLDITTEQRPADWDTDQDGIPDWFEEAVGSDPASANHNDINNAEGYTDLEVYLNWMAVPHFLVNPQTTLTLSLNGYFAGYTDYTVLLPESPVGVTLTVDAAHVLSFRSESPMIGSFPITAIDNHTGVQLTRTFNFCATDNKAAGLSQIPASPATSPSNRFYTLDGRTLLSAPTQKGVYIHQGKKVVVK